MIVYGVFFKVDYEGESLEGVFSTLDLAREQIERSIEIHNTYGHDLAWTEVEEGVWQKLDFTLEIVPITVDRKLYERT